MALSRDSQIQLIIHGHFYQPPRENPWTGEVEQQDSAAPYHDWNARITAECYTPNTRSRVLDGRGRVMEVVNNYRHLSFNFGPTLFSYLEKQQPETYRKILLADQESVRERGSGNAIAQAYNHMILPLASAKDRWTQIVWGLEDFRARFRRNAEALWLPETAVNADTLQDLARAGMKFLLLAPSQAEAMRPLDTEKWQDVSAGNIPTHRPYLCLTKAGNIRILFYHAELSRAVAFEHILRNAGIFADRIASVAADAEPDNGDRLVLVCTDGESYGHHEPMGDMCLAYLATREAPSRGMVMTNPAAYLERHPPAFEVKLKPGEGTAWSCAHGVGRWKQDCGCSTGGPASWHQGWRAPLRRAFDQLRRTIDPLFEKEAGKLLQDPWKARDDYIAVILGRPVGAGERFFKQHARRELSDDERARVHRLLEMQHHAMLMYTSCGWFFSDLSGMETITNMRYAVRASQLAQLVAGKPVDQEFLQEMGMARSNISSMGTGLDLIERQVLPSALTPEKVAAHLGFLALTEPLPPERTLFRFRVQVHQQWSERHEEFRALACRLTLKSELTSEGGNFETVLLSAGNLRLRTFVRPFEAGSESLDLSPLLLSAERDGFGETCRQARDDFAAGYGLHDMLPELRAQVVQAVLSPLLHELEEAYEQAFTRNESLLRMLASFRIGLPQELKLVAGYAGSRRFNRLVERNLDRDDLDAAVEMASVLEALGVTLDRQEAGKLLAGRLRELLDQILQQPKHDDITRFIRLLQSARSTKLEVDEASLQDKLATSLRPSLDKLLVKKASAAAREVARALVELAGYLNLNTEESQQRLREADSN